MNAPQPEPVPSFCCKAIHREARQGSKIKRMLNHVKLHDVQTRLFRTPRMLLSADKLAFFALPYDILAIGRLLFLPRLAFSS
jgi:hypothetical protein